MRKKLKDPSLGRPSASLAPLKIICILSRHFRGIFKHCVEKLETRSNRKCNLLWPPFSCLVFRLFLLKEKGKEEGAGGRVQYGKASFELMSFCSYSEDFPLQLGLLSNSG